MSFSEWKNYKLGDDVVTKLGDGLHGTPIYDDNGEYYFINGSNLVDGKIVINSNTKKVTEEQFIKYKKDLSERTILLGINGTIGNIALYNNEMCILGKSAAYLNINDDFDKQFIRYVLANDHFQNYIKNNASGTTIKNVGLGLLREYEFLAPNKTKQTKIANILSSIDVKIELNNQTNQTLETIAQTLFKEMCLPKSDILPDGWKVGKLGQVMISKGGTTPSTKNEEYWGGEYSWVTPKDLSNIKTSVLLSSDRTLTEKGLKQISSGLLPKGTLLMSSRAPIGYFAISQIPVAINQGFIAINGTDLSNLFLLYWLKLNLETVKSMGNGSTFLEISKSVFREIDIIIPNENVLKEFEEQINPIFENIVILEQETQTLIALRDSLLPKLMKGEIEINNL